MEGAGVPAVGQIAISFPGPRGATFVLFSEHCEFPPFAKNAKDGAPVCLGYVTKIKIWATRRGLMGGKS